MFEPNVRFLKLISRELALTLSDVCTQVGLEPSVAKDAMQRLVERGFVKVTYVAGGAERVYAITAAGIRELEKKQKRQAILR